MPGSTQTGRIQPAAVPSGTARHDAAPAPGASTARGVLAVEDLIYVGLTIAMFVLFALLVKGAEKL